MKNPRVARRYAVALMEVVQEEKCTEKAAADMTLIGSVLKSSRDLEVALASPVVPEPKKSAVLHELFGSRIHPLTLAFLDLLVRKHRELFLREVAEHFLALWDLQRGVSTVQISAAVDLDDKQQRALKAELEKQTGKTVRMVVKRDQSILGGLVIRIGDTVRDSSVVHQLSLLRERFMGSGRGAAQQ